MYQNFKKIILILISLFIIYVGYHYKKFIDIRAELVEAKHAIQGDYKIKPIFTKEGIDSIALIMMVKDEEDIIFENLVWHFAIGFRKFVIVDNMSTDLTRNKIEKFKKETANLAKVFIIDDPIMEYIQSRITTGMYYFANTIWPELEWIFPVDADEFWLPKKDFKKFLANIPKDRDAIETYSSQYHASDDFDLESNNKFYTSLPFRIKSNYFKQKVAVRAGIKDLIINQGNHSAYYENPRILFDRLKISYLLKPSKVKATKLSMFPGNINGLEMREFPLRSVSQVHKKYLNGARANLAAKRKNLIRENWGNHWDDYEKELANEGMMAAVNKFKENMKNKDQLVFDPFPFDAALKIYNEVIKE